MKTRSPSFRQRLTDRAREMRREPSLAERKLWLHLRNDQFMGVRFRRQFRIGAAAAAFYAFGETAESCLGNPSSDSPVSAGRNVGPISSSRYGSW